MASIATNAILERFGELSAEFRKKTGHTVEEMNPIARSFAGECEERHGLIILGPIGTCAKARQARKEFVAWLQRKTHRILH